VRPERFLEPVKSNLLVRLAVVASVALARPAAEANDYFGVNVASGQLDAHFPEVMSAQLSLLRHCAQVLSGLPQLASHDRPDEFRLQDTSLSPASLQLALAPHPASATPNAATHAIHQLFTCSLPWSRRLPAATTDMDLSQ
jgi:hypothetical protein